MNPSNKNPGARKTETKVTVVTKPAQAKPRARPIPRQPLSRRRPASSNNPERRPPRIPNIPMGRTANCSALAAQYLGTLLDPFQVRGARIPDEITTSSATCPLSFQTTLSPVAGFGLDTGTYAAGIILFPEAMQNGSAIVPYGQNCIGYLQAATGGNGWYFPNTPAGISIAGTSFNQQPGLFGTSSSPGGVALGYRIVSAAVAAWNSSSTNSNGGFGTAFQMPYNHADIAGLKIYNPAVGARVADFVNLGHADRVPMQQDQVVGVNYWPDTRDQYSYSNSGGQPFTSQNYSALGLFIVTNAPAAGISPTIEVKITLNIEYIPTPTFQGVVPTNTSRYCVQAMEAAVNARPDRRDRKSVV